MHRRLSQLDGIRGIAVLVVILHNEGSRYPTLHLPRLFADGWMGVDLFFVLSGFLITGILLDSKQSEYYFRNFYARRCLRIWPLYFSLLLLMFGVIPALSKSAGQAVFSRSMPWWSYILLLQNLLVTNPTNAVGLLAVTWSLAVEEQFYAVWPWVVRFFSTNALQRITLAVMCLSPFLRLVLAAHQVNLYANTLTRLDGLMAGSLLAVLTRSKTLDISGYERESWFVFFLTAALALLTESLNMRWITFSLSAAASATLVYLALYSRQTMLQRILTNRFLVYTGTISYGLYLLHKLPFDAAIAAGFAIPPAIELLLLLASCYAIATLSWRVWEKPFLRLKRFFETKSASEAMTVASAQ